MDETELKQQISDLRNEYTESIPVRIDEINANLQILTGSPQNSDQLADLHRRCHTLKGSAATFGFNELSRQAGVMEQQIRVLQDTADADIVWELQLLISECEQLKLLSQDLPVTTPPKEQQLQHVTASQQRNGQFLIYLAEDDLHQAAELGADSQPCGLPDYHL